MILRGFEGFPPIPLCSPMRDGHVYLVCQVFLNQQANLPLLLRGKSVVCPIGLKEISSHNWQKKLAVVFLKPTPLLGVYYCPNSTQRVGQKIRIITVGLN